MPEISFSTLAVYFVYGLAFFGMGLAMLFEARRSPLLAEARVLRPLAFFGLVHGSHEWLEMALLLRGSLGLAVPVSIQWLRLGILVVSFIALIVFAVQVFRPEHARISRREVLTGTAMLALFLTLQTLTMLGHPSNAAHGILHADALARYILAAPAAFLAGLALERQATRARLSGRIRLAPRLSLAAWGFALYGLTQVLAPAVDFFPAQFLNAPAFQALTGMPIQAVRAFLAVLITGGLFLAAQSVDEERQSALQAAQQARLTALEQVQRQLEEREALRRHLLRHTVIAQEEERARISRELHDETAQFLTALSLDLATLQRYTQDRPEAVVLLERLRNLSGDMSQGIHRMVRDLRPAHLDDLGLAAALHYLADESLEMGLKVELQIQGARQRLDPLSETVLFRVAQEALTNAARHAGTKRAWLALSYTPEAVTLSVRDDGVGFNVEQNHLPPHGWGLAGMRERAESIGGRLRVESQPGTGTQVEIHIPVARKEQLGVEERADEIDPVNVGG
jgi:two-component system sensor histidine kinase UhpB